MTGKRWKLPVVRSKAKGSNETQQGSCRQADLRQQSAGDRTFFSDELYEAERYPQGDPLSGANCESELRNLLLSSVQRHFVEMHQFKT